MLPATPSRRIILKLALAVALLTLAAAARLPFIGNILAGEEGYFAALVLNGTPTSALDDRHLPREIAGFIDGKPVLQTFHRTVMPYVIMETIGRAVAVRNALGRLPTASLSIAARWPFAFMFLLVSIGLAGPAAHETLLLCGCVVGTEVGILLVRLSPPFSWTRGSWSTSDCRHGPSSAPEHAS